MICIFIIRLFSHIFFSCSTFQADVVVVISSNVNKTEFLLFVIKNIIIIFVIVVIVFPVVVAFVIIVVVVGVVVVIMVRRRRWDYVNKLTAVVWTLRQYRPKTDVTGQVEALAKRK